jgi:hypothetical protein
MGGREGEKGAQERDARGWEEEFSGTYTHDESWLNRGDTRGNQKLYLQSSTFQRPRRELLNTMEVRGDWRSGVGGRRSEVGRWLEVGGRRLEEGGGGRRREEEGGGWRDRRGGAEVGGLRGGTPVLLYSDNEIRDHTLT